MARRTKRRRGGRAAAGRVPAGRLVALAGGLAAFVVVGQVLREHATAAGMLALAVAGGGAAVAVWRGRRRAEAARRAAERQAWLDRQVSTTDGMTGPEFERLVARLLVRDGHTRVQVLGGANDLGADVVGIDPAGRRVVVQCKRYTGHPVDSPAVQRFLGTVWQHHGADVGVIVTTSRFTAPAARLAARHGLHLVDRRRLAEWMAGAPPSAERNPEP